jgi:hypothetical protein
VRDLTTIIDPGWLLDADTMIFGQHPFQVRFREPETLRIYIWSFHRHHLRSNDILSEATVDVMRPIEASLSPLKQPFVE